MRLLLLLGFALVSAGVLSLIGVFGFLRSGTPDQLLSESRAVDAVARELCPQNPESIVPALSASYDIDSLTYRVFVRADVALGDPREGNRALARYTVVDGGGGLQVEPAALGSEEFTQTTRADCAAGIPPFPP